jgi:hypothetical protein
MRVMKAYDWITLFVGLVLSALVIDTCAGCSSGPKPPPVVVTPPPVTTPQKYSVHFAWTPPAMSGLMDCGAATNETDSAGIPCEEYQIVDQSTGVTVATPPLTASSYVLIPGPTAWPHTYAIFLYIQGPDPSHFTRSIVPGVTTVVLP